MVRSLTLSCSYSPELAVGAWLIMATRKTKDKRKQKLMKKINSFKNMFEYMPVVVQFWISNF